MEHIRAEQKPQNVKISPKQAGLAEMNLDDIKSHDSLNMSPRAQGISSGKPSSARLNCLCSPTTHAGSFRCRHHRLAGIQMPRGGSVGSNLSLLASKTGRLSNSPEAQY